MIINWNVVLLLLVGVLFSACQSKKDQIFTLQGKTMGQVSYRILVVTDASNQSSIQNGIDSTLDNIVDLMSTYEEDSEVSLFNELPSNEVFTVNQKTFDVLSLSQKISQQTNGAFDITVGPLVDLWGFGPKARPEQIPDPMQIMQSFELIGYDALKLNSDEKSIVKESYRRIDLSAIAKGYAVDEIANYLDLQQIQSYMIEVGGEIRLKGLKPNSEKWRIAIEVPKAQFTQEIHSTLSITDKSIATSGDYRNFFEVDGVRFSHTIDPKTGYPIDHNLASVTVLAQDCATADAMATALMVMGDVEGLKFANENNIAAFFIIKKDKGFEQVSSQSYKIFTNESE